MNCASDELTSNLKVAGARVVEDDVAVGEAAEADLAEVPVVGDRDASSPVPATAVACRSTTGAVGSLLTIRIVVVSVAPMTVGA